MGLSMSMAKTVQNHHFVVMREIVKQLHNPTLAMILQYPHYIIVVAEETFGGA